MKSDFDNNAPKDPKVTSTAGYKIIEPESMMSGEIKPSGGTAMAAISGSETNSLEKCPLKGQADGGSKPLVATGKQVVKASGKK